jgi:hypothetical protein
MSRDIDHKCQANLEMSYCYQSRNVPFWAKGGEGAGEMEGARRATGISPGDTSPPMHCNLIL